jgi:hypothetical protein
MLTHMTPRPRLFAWLVGALLVCASFSSPALAQDGASELGAPPAAAGATSVTSASTVPDPPSDGAAATTLVVPDPPGSLGTAAGSYPTVPGAADAAGMRLQIPSRIATRLRVLDADFAAVASRSGGLVNGILSIVTGGLSITLGFLVNDEFLSPYLFVFGGAGVARGILDLLLTPNTHDPYIQFSHMPIGTTEEVYAKLAYGEQALESIARRFRIARILDASINIGVGLAILPLYLGPNDFEIDAFGAFVIIGAGISVVSGVISLISRTEAERRWSGYEELVERLDERESAGVNLRFGAAPLPGGGAISLGGTF